MAHLYGELVLVWFSSSRSMMSIIWFAISLIFVSYVGVFLFLADYWAFIYDVLLGHCSCVAPSAIGVIVFGFHVFLDRDRFTSYL